MANHSEATCPHCETSVAQAVEQPGFLCPDCGTTLRERPCPRCDTSAIHSTGSTGRVSCPECGNFESPLAPDKYPVGGPVKKSKVRSWLEAAPSQSGKSTSGAGPKGSDLVGNDGQMRCASCGGTQFKEKRSVGQKATFGVLSLAFKGRRVECLSCGRRYLRG